MCDCRKQVKDQIYKYYEKEGKNPNYIMLDNYLGVEIGYTHTAKTGRISNKTIKSTVQMSYCPFCGKKIDKEV